MDLSQKSTSVSTISATATHCSFFHTKTRSLTSRLRSGCLSAAGFTAAIVLFPAFAGACAQQAATDAAPLLAHATGSGLLQSGAPYTGSFGIHPSSLSSEYSSSSNDQTYLLKTTSTDRLPVSDSLQPPPRRTYGRPRYSDNQHNADGSNKYTFLLGGGLTLPISATHNDFSPSYNIQGGVGRNFSNAFGVIAQFDWANFGIQSSTLNNLLRTYNSIGASDQNGNPLSQLDGSSHVWSLTLNPIYYLAHSDTKGLYVVAGAGFYHKTTNFSIPGTGTYCDPYYGCYPIQSNQTIDKYTSNAFGVNGGVGFTYKTSRFGSARLYVEGRYVFVDNQPRPYSTGSAKSSYFNVFPQNSARTTYIPITIGVRF